MMSDKQFSITVATVTRRRPELLLRAILSVQQQILSGEFHHLIAIDDCPETKKMLDVLSSSHKNVAYVYFERSEKDVSGPSRLADIRNAVASHTSTEWISFLDDDNEYESHHLQEIYNTILLNPDAKAVHSCRKLFHANGMPFVENFWPWVRDPEKSREKYRYMVERGFLTAGSNIIQDGLAWGTVDTNTWAIKRETLLENQMSNDFSMKEWEDNKAEDDKLLWKCLENSVNIVATGKATVRYYIGGYSTDFSENPERSERWAPPVER